MIEATGDLFTYMPADARCITTNAEWTGSPARAVMGKGIALEAKKRFPGIDLRLATLIQQHDNRPMKLGHYGSFDDSWIVSFPTKIFWKDPADLDLILQSALKLRDMADRFEWRHVVMPRPGVGEGRRDWLTQIRPLLVEVLDDRFTVVTR